MIKIVVLALVLCCVSAIQPGCRTRYELRMKWTVQNNFNRYWECSQWGYAVQRTCPTATPLFSAAFQDCLPVDTWAEAPFFAPPTEVDNYVDQCVAIECIDCSRVQCEGGIVVDDECECPESKVLDVNGICVGPVPAMCIGGQIIDGVCVCFDPNATVENGVCVTRGTEEENCGEDAVWNEIELRCICNDGSQFINGRCGSGLGICPGAPDSAYIRGTLDCEKPMCTTGNYWPNIHWPTRNPRTFWQCPQIERVREMPCGGGTCFSYSQQTCVHARDWVNECN